MTDGTLQSPPEAWEHFVTEKRQRHVLADPSGTEDHLGRLLVGSTLLAGACRGLSGLTAGADYGGRYDVAEVNSISWIAFLVFSLIAVMLVVIGLLRIAESLMLRRTRRPEK